MKQMWHHSIVLDEELGRVRHNMMYRDKLFTVTKELFKWKHQRVSSDVSSDPPRKSGHKAFKAEQSQTSSSVQDFHKKGKDMFKKGYLSSDELLQALTLSPIDAYRLMVAARMHWGLGRMNMPRTDDRYLDADGYLQKFAAQLSRYSQCGGGTRVQGPDCIRGPTGQALFECRRSKHETRKLLKLCIAVAAADISGSSPSREVSRAGTDDERRGFTSDADNGALQLCRRIQSLKKKQGANRVTDDPGIGALHGSALQLIEEICTIGCIRTRRTSSTQSGTLGGMDCALTPIYPGKDVWTLYGFEGKGLGYRSDLLQRFDELAASSGSYEAWCDTTVKDLDEMPKIMYAPMLRTDVADETEGITMYLNRLPLTGKEKSSCERIGETGFIDGLCFQNPDGKCVILEDVTAPCSPSVPLAFGASTKASLGVNVTADRMAFIYHNGNDAFTHFGGMVWMRRTSQGDIVVQVDSIVSKADARDKSRTIRFGKLREVSADHYIALRNALNSGVPLSEYQKEYMLELLTKHVKRYAWAVTTDMPDGGIAYYMS